MVFQAALLRFSLDGAFFFLFSVREDACLDAGLNDGSGCKCSLSASFASPSHPTFASSYRIHGLGRVRAGCGAVNMI